MTQEDIEFLLNAAHLLDELGEYNLADDVRFAAEQHSNDE
jgi:hypothetical protein